ncbi:MAG: ABC transporter substrate-binding protein [Thermoanaerobaculia bacterium]
MPTETSRTHLRAATVALAMVGLAGCGRGEATTASATRQGATGGPRIVVALASDIEGVNPLISGASGVSTQIHDLLFLRLFEERPDFSAGPPSFAPRLAASWRFSPDRLALTVELRPDARWSDGEPVTAEDVVWTWRAQIHPAVAWAYAHSKQAIRSIEARGPHRIEVWFTHAYPTQLADLNEGPILPAHAWGRLPFARWQGSEDWFRQRLVTSGPFRVAGWRPGERLELAPNPFYHQAARPRLDRVVFRVLPDPSVRLLHAEAREVDFVDGIRPADAERLMHRRGLAVDSYWTRHYEYLCWNTARPWFRDAAVRRALTQAIDRRRLVAVLWRGHARVGVSPILQSVWAADPDLEPWPHDPQAARSLLRRAGWIDRDADGVRERDGLPLRFELLVNADNPLRRDAAVLIQQDLRRVGAQATIRTLEFQTLNAVTEAHDFDAFIGAWAVDTTLDLTYAFHSSSIDDGYNFGSYANAELDDLIDRVRQAPGPRVALPMLHRMQRVLHEEQPYTFLWEPRRLTVASRRLRGARPNALSPFFHLEDWRLAPRDSRGS